MNYGPTNRKAQLRTMFDTLAPEYDAAGPGCFAHFGRRLVEVVGVEPGQRVLDVASGVGAVLFPAVERAGPTGEAIGIDLSEAMAGTANAEAARRGLGAAVRIMDAEHLEFPDASFDRVLCGFGLMFFPDQPRVLGEFRRVLRLGGKAGISTWRVDQVDDLRAVLSELGVGAPPRPGWITEPDELRRLLARVGFTHVRVEADSHSFRYRDVHEYWQQARGTGIRRVLDPMDDAQKESVRAALAERMRAHRRSDGIYLDATALLAVAEG